jgi:hypothetical protein
MRSPQTSVPLHKICVIGLESNSLTHLSRGEVAYHADQSISLYPLSYGPIPKVILIRPTKIEHVTHGVEPVTTQLKSAHVISAARGSAIFGYARPVDPMQPLVSDCCALTKKYPEVENCVKPSPTSIPRHQVPVEQLHRFILAQIYDKGTAFAGQPSRDRSKPLVSKVHVHVEFRQERPERVQPLLSVLHKMREIFSATSGKLLCVAAFQMPGTVRSLPVEWLVDGIIGESFRHATSLFYELFRFSAQPVEHGRLHY